MTPETVAQVTNPFFTTDHTTCGPGTALLTPQQSGPPVTCALRRRRARADRRGHVQLAHPDRQPLGDLPGTLLAFLLAEGAPQLRYEHRVMRVRPGRTFRFDTAAIRAELGNVPLNHPAVVQWLAEFLAEGEAELS